MDAPCLANSRTAARPIPAPAPVITTTSFCLPDAVLMQFSFEDRCVRSVTSVRQFATHRANFKHVAWASVGIETADNLYRAAIYNASRVPLSNVTSEENFFLLNDKTCQTSYTLCWYFFQSSNRCRDCE
jgi:hypothetical protein